MRHLDFSNNGITIFSPGARFEWGLLSLLLQGGAVYSSVNALAGYGQGRIEYQLADPLRVYAGFSRGAEAQLLLPQATTTDLIAGALWQLDQTWGLRLDYSYEDRERTYLRNSLGTAVTVRF